MKKQSDLTIFTPISISGDCGTAREVADNILQLYKNCGFDRFALIAPGKGWRSISYPPREHFAEKAELFLEIKELLPPEISCGWWHTLVLKSGPTPGYTRIVRIDGTEAPFSTCPLDENYRKRFAEDVAFFLQKAHPDFFFTEDDFGINCHGGSACFCKHHLEEFARREGRYYSREELAHLFNEKPAESRELLRRWQELAGDSLVIFAQALREEADKLTPEIPMGFMQAGVNQKDGNCAESVARAMAGKNHTPFVRFYGTFYGGEQISDIPQVLLNCLYAKEHIKGEFRFYHESDSFPHTRFFMSGGCMRTMMGAVYSWGYEGSVFQIRQHLDDPDEDPACKNMFLKERARFNAVRRSVEGCRLLGARLHYDPFENCNFPGNKPEWLKVLSAFGIPYTTQEEGDILFVSGEQMRYWPDEKIKAALSGTLFLDGDAARVLTERNFSGFTGARVSEGLLQGSARFDLGAKEVICEKFRPPEKGRLMARADYYCPKGTGFLYKIEITDPGCEEVTQIIDSQKKYTAPGMTFFRNSLGGCVVIYATALEKHFGSSLFNYRRQALLQSLLAGCGAEFPMVRNAPRVCCIANKPVTEKDFSLFVTCTSLGIDPLDEVTLFLPEKERQFKECRILDQEGRWQALPFERTADGVRLKTALNYTEPVYISFV